jgi:DNA-directed RNA polymerase specialized sigma24 family protein
VLVLRYVADLPENQVAAAAGGLSEAAVRHHVALAFSALRGELPSAS